MTAAIDLITDAATSAGAFDPEESLSAGKAQFILRRLNRMIETWANERLMIYETYVDPLTLIANQAAYSSALLPHGNANQWDSAYVRQSGVDYGLELIDQQSYNGIAYKSVNAIPTVLYIATSWPDSMLNFFPAPFGGMSAYIAGRVALTGKLTLTTDVDLPEGYEGAIVDNLAVDISPSFGLQPSQQLLDTARNQKMLIKRANKVTLEMDTGLPSSGGRFDIFAG